MLVFLLTLALFVAFDYIWFTLAGFAYVKVIKNIQKEPPSLNYISSALVYVLLVIFMYVFVIENFDCRTSYADAITYGVIAGGSLYLFVNLVTSSIFNKYTLNLLILDSLWGAVSFALVSVILLAVGVKSS